MSRKKAAGVTRTVDLSGFPAAYLTYTYRRVELPEGATFTVELPLQSQMEAA